MVSAIGDPTNERGEGKVFEADSQACKACANQQGRQKVDGLKAEGW